MLDDVGLTNPAGHYMLPDLLKDLDSKIAFAKEMGQHYMVVTVPWIADVSRVHADPKDRANGLLHGSVKRLYAG